MPTEIGELVARITGDDRDFKRKMAGADSTAKGTARSIGSTFSNLRLRIPKIDTSGISSAFSGIANVAGGNLVSGVISSAISGIGGAMKEGLTRGIEYNKMLETSRISFTTLLGSLDAANKHLRELQAFGEQTPFEFPDLIKASQRMQAMGFAARDVIPNLRAIGDAVAAVGGGKEELDGVVMALGQMQTKGKVSAEEMNQLAERGIPAWDLLAKAIGRTKEETIKLSEQGRLRGDRAIQGIVAMMGERFGGQMDRLSQTLAGRESNFQDILNRQLGGATEGAFDQLKQGYVKATEGLSTAGAQAFAVELNKLLTEQAAIAQRDLDKIASGEYFREGARATQVAGKTLGSLERAGSALSKGQYREAAEEAGVGVAEGFKYGFYEKGDEIDRAVVDFFSNMIKKVKDALGEQSPSTVFAEIGADVVAGFDLGVTRSVDRSSEGMKRWAKQIAKNGGEEFIKAVEEMAARLKLDPNKLLNVMAFESRLNPKAKNPKSSATGLIQFMDDTAEALGTTVEKLQGMGAIEQLKYVEAYFKQFRNLADTQEAIYTAVLAGRPVADPEALLFKEGGKRTGRAYTANRALDTDRSGRITAGEATAKVFDQGFLKKTEDLMMTYAKTLEKLTGVTNTAVAQFQNFTTALAEIPSKLKSLRPGDGAIAQPLDAGTIIGRLDPVPVSEFSRGLGEINPKVNLASLALQAFDIKLKTIPPPAAMAGAALDKFGSKAGQFADAIVAASSKFGTAEERLSSFKDRLGQGFDDLIGALVTGSDRWQDVARNIAVDFFNTLASEMMLAATGGKYGSVGGLLGGLVGGLFGGLFGGGKQHGGDVRKGMVYPIGEAGMELFAPGMNGRIIPASQTRQMISGTAQSGQTIIVNNNFNITAPGGRVAPETQAQIATRAGQGIQAAILRNT